MSINKIIGANIRKHRKLSKLSQANIAARIEITARQLRYYESGDSAITVATLWELSTIFNVSIRSFFNCSPRK